MTNKTQIAELRNASRRETFENQAAEYEKCSLSFIISLRNKKGGYDNEKIDDMWWGFKLAVAPPWGRTVGEVAIESNRLFHEKKALSEQLEAAEVRIAGIEKNLDAALYREKRVYRQLLAKEAELAALRGAAVPVAWVEASTERLIKKYDEKNNVHIETTLWFKKRFNTDVPIFTHAQPVPVVLLPTTYWSFDDDSNPVFDADEVIAALEKSGVAFKYADGEGE